MLDLDTAMRALASGTSRRSFLARLGGGLVGAGLLTVGSPRRAAAASCGCTGQNKCPDQPCGSTLPNTNFCCSCNPPCFDCAAANCTAPVTCAQATCCIGTGFTPGWFWYCCKANPNLGNALWKCQDCCNNFGDCYTSRDIIGAC